MSNSPTLSGLAIRGLLYTHNPFYLVSALLVLVGLHKALADNSSLAGGWLLMGTLCGYTLLLVVAGYVIVRYGQVWQDARMILLVIVLLFLALSVSFDRMTLVRPLNGAGFLLAGWCFAVLVSEAVFYSLKIHLPASYLLPYYLVLTLLFGYPVGLAVLSVEGRDVAMAWGVFGFPVAAAAALLTLWPAARAPQDEAPSGTPWRWPWFPWTLFFFLLLAVMLRTYSLSMAFEAAKGSAVSFQPYFLSPLVLASAVLLFEAATVNGSRRGQQVALLLPAAVLLWSFPGSHCNPVADRFLLRLSISLGSPLQLALVGLAAFWALAWLRGQRAAEWGLIGCAALASLAGRWTVDLDSLTSVQPWPLAVLAAWQLPRGLWQKSSWRTLIGTIAGLTALGASRWAPDQGLLSRYVLGHALAVMTLVTAAMYDDDWARWVRRNVGPLVPWAALAAATGYEYWFPDVPRIDHAIYLAGLLAVGVLYWRWWAMTPQMLAALATGGCLLLFGGRSLYLWLETSPLDKGLPWLAGGLTALGVALALSLRKGGLLVRAWHTLRALNKA